MLDAIGPYRIRRKLRTSSLGAHYEAVHEESQRPALVLIIGGEYTKDPGQLKRLLTEARAADAVEHASFVPVADRGELPDGTVYLVYELPAGETLRQQLKRQRGPMAVDRAIHVARQLAGALAAAHARGLVHRDLQPEHILLVGDPADGTGEQAKLLDFGITNFAERWQATLAAAQCELYAITGNPTYMSPEQCSGSGIVDDKTDVYSLGVIVYQMLTGRPPFGGEGYGVLIGQHLYKEALPLAQAAPAAPAGLADLVHQMLIKQRERRPTMEQVAAALSQPLSVRPVGAPAGSPVGSPVGPAESARGAAVTSLVNPFGATGRFSSPGTEPATDVHQRGAETQPARPRRPNPRLGIVALAGLVALTGGLAWLLHRSPNPVAQPQRPAAQAEESAPIRLAQAGRTPPPVSPAADTEAAGGVVAPQRPKPAEVPAPRSGPRLVRWQLSSDPPGALVIRVDDNQQLGTTPWMSQQPAATGLLTLLLHKGGFADARIILDRSETSIREISLSRKSGPVVSALKRYPVAGQPVSKPAGPPAGPRPAPPRLQTF